MTSDPMVPSAAQLSAIEAGLGPQLVLAGPGAGKTYCLIERIRYLIQHHGIAPDRICAVTFTNKAAEEVASRLTREMGDSAEAVTRSTIHSLCVAILRKHGSVLGLERGFGIADEDYQKAVLGRLQIPPRMRGSVLARFGLHRMTSQELSPEDQSLYLRYRERLDRSRMVDFDDLVVLTAGLLTDHAEVRREVAGQWDYLLVDEFQDLNTPQYTVIRRLAEAHRNIFAVGDDEQSIFSWTGADPQVILRFMNDFGVTRYVVLDENRRTARQIFEFARALVACNAPLLEEKRVVASRETAHPVEARSFGEDLTELRWLLADLKRDRAEAGLPWGEYAVLYRKHAIGDYLEGALMRAGVPCRMAHGRALSDDPVVGYLIAALGVVAYPGDSVMSELFIRRVLPGALLDMLRKQADAASVDLVTHLRRRATELPPTDEEGRKIRRALATMSNLASLPRRHEELTGLVDEVLSQRVGEYQTLLEENADQLSDPVASGAVRRLAEALLAVRAERRRVLLPAMQGLEIGLAGLLGAAGFRWVDYLSLIGTPAPGDFVLDPSLGGELGFALTVFKALQLVQVRSSDSFRDFTVVDLETTDKDAATAEIVEVAALRVRNWVGVEEFHRLVKPRVPVAPGAARTHGYSEQDLAAAPYFEEIWPALRDFLGEDVLVAHNGYSFDFPILRRMSGAEFATYDTLPLARALRVGSARLEHLAERFGIDPGDPHKALWDVRTLAKVFRKLEEERVSRQRRVTLSNALDYLGLVLALVDPEALTPEAAMLKQQTAVYALGRYTTCLDFYRSERERARAVQAPTLDEVIERLGGQQRMLRIRAERSSEQRYPAAMSRVKRLLEGLEAIGLDQQITEFLALVALSRSDGTQADPERVNLLTLHSTKGLEFSRVYIVGVEDTEMPGGPSGRPPSLAEIEEARRVLYVGMTRAKDRLVMTRVEAREEGDRGHRFFDEMGLVPDRLLLN